MYIHLRVPVHTLVDIDLSILHIFFMNISYRCRGTCSKSRGKYVYIVCSVVWLTVTKTEYFSVQQFYTKFIFI